MNKRERMIELIGSAEDQAEAQRKAVFLYGTVDELIRMPSRAENVADYLLDHGVTVQRWIPVTERLPDTIPCGAGWAFSEAVNVLTTGRKVLTAIWDGTDFIADAEFWEAEGEEITHWASVPLPLPEPPKEE
jgi:hypothetical protein